MFVRVVLVVAKLAVYECLALQNFCIESRSTSFSFRLNTALFTLSTCCTINGHFSFYCDDFINILRRPLGAPAICTKSPRFADTTRRWQTVFVIDFKFNVSTNLLNRSINFTEAVPRPRECECSRHQSESITTRCRIINYNRHYRCLSY